MNQTQSVHHEASVPFSSRSWHASLSLSFAPRAGKTKVTQAVHQGPLRVQRAFYPETGDCCHLYLLHPPGGLVVGDVLSLSARAQVGAQVLLTTPSAGRIYGAKQLHLSQRQEISLDIAAGACVEWLPQETIVYDGARAHLSLCVNLEQDAQFFGWDMVRLGRIASGERFKRGYCHQDIRIYRDQRLVFVEKNRIIGGESAQAAPWGWQGAEIAGTLLASMTAGRDNIEAWLAALDESFPGSGKHWGFTQKEDWFIVRYLGCSVTDCRLGFEFIWQQARPFFNSKVAVRPRIWDT